MTDREILYGLAAKVAEIAALPVQKEKINLWTANNDLQTVSRPPVYIDQLPWHEINRTDEMKLLIDASYGRKTKAVILMDTDHVILSAFPTETIAARWMDKQEKAEEEAE